MGEVKKPQGIRMLYGREEAAFQLSVSTRTIDRMLALKKFANTRRIGRRVMIPHGELVRVSRMDHFDLSE
jgi:hypothetical protein